VRGTQEQGATDLGFQVLDLHRQGRLADADLLGCAGEAALFGHGEEIAKVSEFHDDERAGLVISVS
jgi:hypothetical protein